MKILDFISEYSGLIGFGIMFFIAFIGIKLRSKNHVKAKKNLEKSIKDNLNEPMTLHPSINQTLCAGCGSCVKACPEGEILQLIDHKAVLVHPSKCVGHGACEQSCPFGAIDLVFGTKTRGMEIPRITPDFETNINGLYIAGELGGMGLIRNAVKQGRLACEHAISKLSLNLKADADIFIVGAGPAGFSTALMAIEKNKSYILIEQNSFGGTIYNFPRQKIVTSHPLELPTTAPKKFKKNVVLKEEILEFFNQIKIKTKLKINEKETFKNLKKLDSGLFEIETNKKTYTAQKVILCMGVRGSPRKLGLPNEDMPKVTYNLIDPEEYKNSSIAIVGGGNAGLEAAQYLAKDHLKNDVHLIVRGNASEAFARANEQNQKLVFDLEKKGKIKIHYDSETKAIESDHIMISESGELKKVMNDFIFIFAGADVPFKFLMSLGIQIDKAHGDVRK